MNPTQSKAQESKQGGKRYSPGNQILAGQLKKQWRGMLINIIQLQQIMYQIVSDYFDEYILRTILMMRG